MLYAILYKRNRLLKGMVYMKNVLKVLAALAAVAGAALLLKLAADVLGACSHKYFEVETD